MLLRQSVLAVNVVSHPVGLLRFPLRRNSTFQSAPRAVSITKISPLRLKAMPFATSDGIQCVGSSARNGHVLCPGAMSRMSAPRHQLRGTDLRVRHRLYPEYFLAIDRRGGCTVGSRTGYLPNPSLARGSVARPEITAPVKSDPLVPGTPEA